MSIKNIKIILQHKNLVKNTVVITLKSICTIQ